MSLYRELFCGNQSCSRTILDERFVFYYEPESKFLILLRFKEVIRDF